MKNSVKLLGLFLLLFTIVFTSCEKDETANVNDVNNDPKEVIKHYVEIDGNKSKMDTMYDAYSKDAIFNIYYHEYLLLEKEAEYNGFMQRIMGFADGFGVMIATGNNSYPPEGTYILDSTGTAEPGEIWDAVYYYNDYNFFLGSGDNVLMKSGSITITGKGGPIDYKIEGSFKGEDGKEYKIFYDGNVPKVFID